MAVNSHETARRKCGGRPFPAGIDGRGQDAGPDRLWRVAIRERGDQTVAVRPSSGLLSRDGKGRGTATSRSRET
jgi:hypothetical protein